MLGHASLNKCQSYEVLTTNIRGISFSWPALLVGTMHSISVWSNYVLFHSHPSGEQRWWEKPSGFCSFQESTHCLHQRSAGGAREGVSLQPIPVPAEACGDGQFAQPKRAADQDLVPEQADEVQERSKVERHRLVLRGTVPHRKPTSSNAVLSWFHELYALNGQLRRSLPTIF